MHHYVDDNGAQCSFQPLIHTLGNFPPLHNLDPSSLYAGGLWQSSRNTRSTGNGSVENSLLAQDDIDSDTTIQSIPTTDHHNNPLADNSEILKSTDTVVSEPDETMTELVDRSQTPDTETEQFRNVSKQWEKLIDKDDQDMSSRGDEISIGLNVSPRLASTPTSSHGK